MIGEIHLSQMNHGGGLGRNEPPKSRKMTLQSGARICEISSVGLTAPMASAKPTLLTR